MADGIVDFVEFAMATVFAAPVALLGVIMASNGDPVGGVGFLAVAAGMVAFDRLVLAPRDVVADALRGLVGRAVGTDENDES